MLHNKLRTKSYRLAFAAVGLFLMGHAPGVLAQCTTTAWTSTTGSVTAVGSPIDEMTELEYEGSCGLSVTAASPGYVTSGAPNQDEQVLTRFYLYADELELDEGTEAIVFRARGNSATQMEVAIQPLGSGLGLALRVRSDGGLVPVGEVAPLLPTWQAVTVGWAADAVAGTVYLKLDDVEMLRSEGLENGGEHINNLDLGLIGNVAGSGKIVVDAIEARRAMPEPGLLALNELFSISTRSYVDAGISAAVAGFIVEGATKKCVIIRGRGQSINLDTTLVGDPLVILNDATTGAELDSNDDWEDHPNAAVVGATRFAPRDPTDSAIYTCLDPGIYTVDLAPAPNSTPGIGIIEVLDLDRGTPFLFSISTRAEVRGGDELAIAGFIIEGDLPKTVLIRGRGPSIRLDETLLEDPTLALFNAQGGLIGSNDNWEDTQATEIGETGRAPREAVESAILVTLDPGLYTVHLQPNPTTGSGIGIIEVIDLTGGTVEDN